MHADGNADRVVRPASKRPPSTQLALRTRSGASWPGPATRRQLPIETGSPKILEFDLGREPPSLGHRNICESTQRAAGTMHQLLMLKPGAGHQHQSRGRDPLDIAKGILVFDLRRDVTEPDERLLLRHQQSAC